MSFLTILCKYSRRKKYIMDIITGWTFGCNNIHQAFYVLAQKTCKSVWHHSFKTNKHTNFFKSRSILGICQSCQSVSIKTLIGPLQNCFFFFFVVFLFKYFLLLIYSCTLGHSLVVSPNCFWQKILAAKCPDQLEFWKWIFLSMITSYSGIEATKQPQIMTALPPYCRFLHT